MVCHKCDNSLCVNPDHLFLGTKLENFRDMERKGRRVIPRGSQKTLAKINEDDALQIKMRLRDGFTQKSIANEFGISRSIVQHIGQGLAWRHVSLPESETL
jgi:DNA invertase Pin-like site-specific DNA recombinase